MIVLKPIKISEHPCLKVKLASVCLVAAAATFSAAAFAETFKWAKPGRYSYLLILMHRMKDLTALLTLMYTKPLVNLGKKF